MCVHLTFDKKYHSLVSFILHVIGTYWFSPQTTKGKPNRLSSFKTLIYICRIYYAVKRRKNSWTIPHIQYLNHAIRIFLVIKMVSDYVLSFFLFDYMSQVVLKSLNDSNLYFGKYSSLEQIQHDILQFNELPFKNHSKK